MLSAVTLKWLQMTHVMLTCELMIHDFLFWLLQISQCQHTQLHNQLERRPGVQCHRSQAQVIDFLLYLSSPAALGTSLEDTLFTLTLYTVVMYVYYSTKSSPPWHLPVWTLCHCTVTWLHWALFGLCLPSTYFSHPATSPTVSSMAERVKIDGVRWPR